MTRGLPLAWQQGLRVGIPVALISLLAVMILPLPAFALDLLISLNVAISMVILLTAISIENPLNFSVLPSVLLIATVTRLGLNVASTRRILLHGSDGTDAAGSVIEAFGSFVVGGNLVVGIVVFLVLLAVQFIVINHGANRISEVAARFTLDAMPGKQMAIDADLNAGLIDEKQARDRREAIQREADFFGSMDGAVKFTQRDAIASIIIVAINIIAGLVIGIAQAGMAPLEAVTTYTVLTVGDGLVSAIPALLVSVAGALMTTRSGSREELAGDLIGQLLSRARPLAIAAAALGGLALVPGMPTFAFLTLAATVGGVAYMLREREEQGEQEASDEPAPMPPEEPIEPLLQVDPLTIEVGYELVTLAGSEEPGGLLDRIRKIRRQMALELGLIVPPVRVRDNLNLAPDEYKVLLRGVTIGSARLPRGRSLAIDPGDVLEELAGDKTLDPAFGIEALWIDDRQINHARTVGYTIVDHTSVIGTHLSELVRRHAPDLLGRQDTQRLLDAMAQDAPKLLEELVPESYSVGQIQKVLQRLLAERVSIRDMETICEALADCAGANLSIEELVNAVRRALGRSIVQPLLKDNTLHVVTLSPEVDRSVRELIRPEDGQLQPVDPGILAQLSTRISTALRGVPEGMSYVLLGNDGPTRTFLRRLTENGLSLIPVLSMQEVPDGISVRAVGQVR